MFPVDDPGRRAARLLAATALFLTALLPLGANPFLAAPAGSDGATTALPTAPGAPAPRIIVDLQFAFRDRIAGALETLKGGGNAAALGAFLGGAFLYGIFHAAGPGHRKTVVFSLFLARKAAPWEPMAAGFLSAGVHAAAGIAVVMVIGLLRGAVASLAATSAATSYIEGGTFIALVVVATLLAAFKLVSLATGAYREHAHRDGRAKGLYGIVVLTSLVPCPGAVIVLLFSLYLNLTGLGIAGVLAMSAGMGIIVSFAAYLAYFGREGLFSRLKKREHVVALVSNLLELGSYLLVLAFSAYMAWPFIVALL